MSICSAYVAAPFTQEKDAQIGGQRKRKIWPRSALEVEKQSQHGSVLCSVLCGALYYVCVEVFRIGVIDQCDPDSYPVCTVQLRLHRDFTFDHLLSFYRSHKLSSS